MCKILLSINPEYVDKIISGDKKYEFRTRIPKRDVDKIIIYSTSPVMKVLAEVDVDGIISDIPSNVWKKTKEYSGIDETFFNDYFDSRETAYAYKLGDVTIYDEPKKLNDFGCKTAPQSFMYLN